MKAQPLMEPACRLALDASFGSVERWRDEFVALGRANGGAGGVLLVFEPRAGRLVNRRVADPAQAPAGDVPLLALDLHAHADVEAFMANIDWAGVYARYQAAVHDASEPFGAAHDEIGNALLLDVRRAGVFEQAQAMLPQARWHDPGQVDAWAKALPAGREVVVYCVYGHEVGRATALRLRAAGLIARYLRGGIDGWQTAGRALVDKPASGAS